MDWQRKSLCIHMSTNNTKERLHLRVDLHARLEKVRNVHTEDLVDILQALLVHSEIQDIALATQLDEIDEQISNLTL